MYGSILLFRHIEPLPVNQWHPVGRLGQYPCTQIAFAPDPALRLITIDDLNIVGVPSNQRKHNRQRSLIRTLY